MCRRSIEVLYQISITLGQNIYWTPHLQSPTLAPLRVGVRMVWGPKRMTASTIVNASVEVVPDASPMADSVDRLVTVEIRNRGMPNGKIAPLYEAARREAGGAPLTYLAAAGLAKRVPRHSVVLIVTGAGSGELIPLGENDGPVGAAILARAVHWGLGATPVLVCEQHHVEPILASCEAAGVGIRPLE